MFSKILALILIALVIYGGLIFLAPEFADTYGHREWNEKIRMMKRISELDRTGGTGSILDKATDIAKPYIDESQALIKEVKTTVDTTKTVIDEKTEQAKQAIEATEKAYESVQDAKSKLENLTTLSGSSTR